jgi:hypothetical protein
MVIRLARCALAFAAVVLLAVEGRTAAAPASEPELKAELIERFTRFVDWDKLPETFSICVVGESPITAHLEKIARRQTFKGKRARVVKAATEAVADCQVVMIPGDDSSRLRAVVSRTDGHPVLSIAEAPGAAVAGAIVNFVIDDPHLRFEINIRAAGRSGLTLRSKLLSLARIVDDRRDVP